MRKTAAPWKTYRTLALLCPPHRNWEIFFSKWNMDGDKLPLQIFRLSRTDRSTGATTALYRRRYHLFVEFRCSFFYLHTAQYRQSKMFSFLCLLSTSLVSFRLNVVFLHNEIRPIWRSERTNGHSCEVFRCSLWKEQESSKATIDNLQTRPESILREWVHVVPGG